MGEKKDLKKEIKVVPNTVEMPKKKKEKSLSFLKDFFKNAVEFLSWIKKQFGYLKLDTFISPKLKNWWNKHKKQRTIAFLVLAVTLFFVSIISLTINLDSLFGKQQSRIRYIEEDGIKYIGIENGYITEKLIVEAGETLPSVSDYFSQNYEIDDEYKISYYKGETAVPVEAFSVKSVEGLLYIVGSNNTLTVKITNFGKEYKSSLLIRDSTAPSIQLAPIKITEGDKVNPVSFVVIFVDNSRSFDFTAEILNEGDYSKPGTYEVELKVCDASSNCTTGKTNLIVEKKKTQSSGGGGSSGGKKPSSGTTNPTGGNTSDDDSGNSSGGGGGSSGGSGGNSGGSGGNSGGSGGNSGGSSGSGGSTLATAGVRKEVGTYTKSNHTLTINYYGTKKKTHYSEVTYKLYDDGFADVISAGTIYSESWDYSGFSNNKTNLSLMKRDAMALFVSSESFYESTQTTFLNASNTERTKKKASKLSIDYHLNVIAQIRCFEIVYGNALGHTRPGNKTVKELIATEYGYKAGKYTDGKRHYGENIAFGQTDAYDAIVELIASPGHYANIIDPSFKKMGVGALYDKPNRRWIRVQIFTS